MRALQASGQRVPALETEPDQDPFDSWVLNACLQLSGERDSQGAMPWRAVYAWAQAHGLDLDETAELAQVIQAGLRQLHAWQAQRK